MAVRRHRAQPLWDGVRAVSAGGHDAERDRERADGEPHGRDAEDKPETHESEDRIRPAAVSVSRLS
jgi:hypothetical protein